MSNLIPFLLSTATPSTGEIFAEWYRNSTLGELISYFRTTYFTLHFGAYDNFAITEQAANTINTIVPAVVWGIIIAVLATFYCRRVVGEFVRTLLKKEVLGPDAAMTLFDLGAFRSTIIRRELCRGAFLRKVVLCREEQDFLNEKGKDATYKIDFMKDHFYIPVDLKDRAEMRFDKKGSGWQAVVLTVVLVPIVVALICRFLPDVLRLIDSLITFFAP